ncbi:hypothetical protein OSCI_2920021 [Kamptonema sp. PCC 6506]|nr:hypothetical protein OSCI_2920021 [Kamptonema sp. PCC 6506]
MGKKLGKWGDGSGKAADSRCPFNLTGLVAQVNRALDDANELCRLLYSYRLLCD